MNNNNSLARRVIASNGLSSEDKLRIVDMILIDAEYIELDEAISALRLQGVIDPDVVVEAAGAITHAGHAARKYTWSHKGVLFDSSCRLRLDDWKHVLRDGKHFK